MAVWDAGKSMGLKDIPGPLYPGTAYLGFLFCKIIECLYELSFSKFR